MVEKFTVKPNPIITHTFFVLLSSCHENQL